MRPTLYLWPVEADLRRNRRVLSQKIRRILRPFLREHSRRFFTRPLKLPAAQVFSGFLRHESCEIDGFGRGGELVFVSAMTTCGLYELPAEDLVLLLKALRRRLCRVSSKTFAE